MQMTKISRRGFLAAGAGAAALSQMPRYAGAQTQGAAGLTLRATSRSLDINGRSATVWGLAGPAGQGLVLDPGQNLQVALQNDLPEPTLIHWHGQIPPNAQDGVPGLPMPLIAPGEARAYDFAPHAGTYWMHAHIPLQEMRLLAAPLIVRSTADLAADRQEVVMFLHDFSFKSPQEVMEQITGGHAHAGLDHANMGQNMGQTGMEHGQMDHSQMSHDSMTHDSMAHAPAPSGTAGQMSMDMAGMDLNDYNWDAYLANDRTLADPDVIRVERAGRIRLRIINAAAATVFWIETGVLSARLVAVDGQALQPLTGKRFGIAMGQRLDLEIDLPGEGAWPILARREGAHEQTGLILATADATVTKISGLSHAKAPAFDQDLSQEGALVAAKPLARRKIDVSRMLMLTGSMSPYLWTIDGKTWGEHEPVTARSGQRVELTFHNMSMMGHPMHLHGHRFQVVNVNGRQISGALRDTVYVPPYATVTIALDAGEAARWMLHCHHMPHLETGMMTEFAVSAS